MLCLFAEGQCHSCLHSESCPCAQDMLSLPGATLQESNEICPHLQNHCPELEETDMGARKGSPGGEIWTWVVWFLEGVAGSV